MADLSSLFALGAGIGTAIGVIMAFARTPPADAKTNLSKWIEFAGIHHIPIWVRSPIVSRVVIGFCTALTGVMVFMMGAFFTDWYNRPILDKSDQQFLERIHRLEDELEKTQKQLVQAEKQPQPSYTIQPPSGAVASRGITWNSDFALVVTGGGPKAEINAILFRGVAGPLVTLKEAFVVSELTGRRQSLYANIPYGGGAVPIEQIEAIPPGAAIDLVLEWKPALSINDFLSQWGKLRFVAKYNDYNYEARFDEQKIRAKVFGEIQGAGGPLVTKKQ